MEKMSGRKLSVSHEQIQAMRRHVEDCFPQEGCGIIGGFKDCAEWVIPVTNVLHSSTRFRMDPREQIDAFYKIEEAGGDLIGIYHSHPAGPDIPSSEDIRSNSFPQAVHLIWYRHQEDWTFKAYWIDAQGKFNRVEIDVLKP